MRCLKHVLVVGAMALTGCLPLTDESRDTPELRAMRAVAASVAEFNEPSYEMIRWRYGDIEDEGLGISFVARPQQFEWWIGLTNDLVEVPIGEESGIYYSELRWPWDGCVEVRGTITRPGVVDAGGEYEIEPAQSLASNVLTKGDCVPGVERIPIAQVPEPAMLVGTLGSVLLLSHFHRRRRSRAR